MNYAVIFFTLLLTINIQSATILYSNEFDGGTTTGAGINALISGGNQTTAGQTGGITSTQGYDAYSSFSGNFWRVTTEDDLLIIQVSGIDTSASLSTSFSLGMIDSWDGSNSRWGVDLINMQIYDGGTVSGNSVVGGTSLAGFSEAYGGSSDLDSTGYVNSVVVDNVQLGFNNGNPWWNEDGFEMEVNDLQSSTGILTFVIWASSGGGREGFQGGNDESFAIDNFLITSADTIVPEPNSFYLGVVLIMRFILSRTRS